MRLESPMIHASAHSTLMADILSEIGTVMLGKPHEVMLATAALLAQGHLLIEDLPGLGKTTLANALARVMGLEFRRVQFTSDLLPADITGFSRWDRDKGEFHFSHGPIFTQLLLADEINRSSPKTQSALLEAMEEGQVSVDGRTHPLPVPFFVVATQNPFSLEGTFPLPESQLDRFLIRLNLGYPAANIERQLLEGEDPRGRVELLKRIIDPLQLMQFQQEVKQVKVPAITLDYVQRLLDATRFRSDFVHGISPRGGMALIRAARAWAFLQSRGYVTPDDIQVVIGPVFGHRLISRADGKPLSLEAVQQWMHSVDTLGY